MILVTRLNGAGVRPEPGPDRACRLHARHRHHPGGRHQVRHRRVRARVHRAGARTTAPRSSPRRSASTPARSTSTSTGPTTPSTRRRRPRSSSCTGGTADGSGHPHRRRRRLRHRLRRPDPGGRQPGLDHADPAAAAGLRRHASAPAWPAASSRTPSGSSASSRRRSLAKVTPPTELVDDVVELAERARREGLLALEDAVKDGRAPVPASAAWSWPSTAPTRRSCATSCTPRSTPRSKADKAGAKIFEDMGGYAPTIGIIGTVMGLVHVLENLGQAGEARSPHRRRVRRHALGRAQRQRASGCRSPPASSGSASIECEQMELVIEGVLAIQAGSNPRLVAQKLRSLLPPDAAAAAEADDRRRRRNRMSHKRRRAPQEAAAGTRTRGARQPRALAGLLRRHAHPAVRAVRRAVLDEQRRPEEVRRAGRRPLRGLRRAERGVPAASGDRSRARGNDDPVSCRSTRAPTRG